MYDVIIPCRNEEKTIGTLVRTFKYHPLIRQVIVVIDGDTTDGTQNEALKNAAVIVFGDKGKGQNIKIGLNYVETERVILCDGDLRGFEREHIDILTRGLSPFVIGVPDFPIQEVLNSPKTTFAWLPEIMHSYPWVSGERVVITNILREVNLHGYLAEVQINDAHAQLGIQPDFRFLAGVCSPFVMSDKRMAEMERDRKWGIENGVFK